MSYLVVGILVFVLSYCLGRLSRRWHRKHRLTAPEEAMWRAIAHSADALANVERRKFGFWLVLSEIDTTRRGLEERYDKSLLDAQDPERQALLNQWADVGVLYDHVFEFGQHVLEEERQALDYSQFVDAQADRLGLFGGKMDNTTPIGSLIREDHNAIL